MVAVVCLVVAAGAASVAAQETDGPPEVPASFHGTVTVDGEPAPEGTEVVAVVDGQTVDTTTVGSNGTYGDPGTLGEKLVVDESVADEGTVVAFRVDGVRAEETVNWTTGTTTRVDLSVSDLDDAGGSALSIDDTSADDAPPESPESDTGADEQARGDGGTERTPDDEASDGSATDDRASEADGALPGFGVVPALLAALLGGASAARQR